MNQIKRLFLHRKYKKVLSAAHEYFTTLTTDQKRALATDQSTFVSELSFSFISALSYDSIQELVSLGFTLSSETPLFDASSIHTDYNPMLCAFTLGNEDAVIAFAELGNVKDAFDSQKMGAIHLATHFGMLRAIRCLINRGCDVNAQSTEGFAPLRIAIHKMDLGCIRLLIELGADICTSSSGKNSSLAPIGIIINSAPHASATFKNSDKILLELLRRGYDITGTTFKDGTFWTPLALYIGRCNERYLGLSFPSNCGRSYRRSRRVIKTFVDRCAPVDMDAANHPPSPLVLCMKHGRYDLLRILLGRRKRFEMDEVVKYNTAVTAAYPSQVESLIANCDNVLFCFRALLSMPVAKTMDGGNGEDGGNGGNSNAVPECYRFWIEHFIYFHHDKRSNLGHPPEYRHTIFKLFTSILHLMSMAFPGYCMQKVRFAEEGLARPDHPDILDLPRGESILSRMERIKRVSPKITLTDTIIDYIRANPLPTLFDLLSYHIEAMDIREDMRKRQ